MSKCKQTVEKLQEIFSTNYICSFEELIWRYYTALFEVIFLSKRCHLPVFFCDFILQIKVY